MKVFGIIINILAALAAIAGIVFVVVKYGDKITAWVKRMLGTCCCTEGECCCTEDDCCCDDACCCESEAPAEEAPVQEAAVEAEDKDFEG